MLQNRQLIEKRLTIELLGTKHVAKGEGLSVHILAIASWRRK